MSECDKIRERYAKRNEKNSLYNSLLSSVYMSKQERERALIEAIKKCNLETLDNKKLLEVGCGNGDNLLMFMRLGFSPENLIGNELLQERVEFARDHLPQKIKIISGDACDLNFEKEYFDIVYQSTVFTSILDKEFQNKLANKMWSLVKPGGYIFWYDFLYDNPKNPDVRGVNLNRIKELFPEGKVKSRKLTLAPPISRKVTKLHPGLYTVFNWMPYLRTHILCCIRK